MSQTTLIIGSTGKVGVELVRLLAEKGEAVRASTRNPSTASARLPRVAEVVEFDFDRPETFAPEHSSNMRRIMRYRGSSDNTWCSEGEP